MPGLFLFLKKRDSTLEVCRTISEETTKWVYCHKNGNLPLFCIEKDAHGGVLYVPIACVLLVRTTGLVVSGASVIAQARQYYCRAARQLRAGAHGVCRQCPALSQVLLQTKI